MKIAGNLLADMHAHYLKEISRIYGAAEAEAIFLLAAEHYTSFQRSERHKMAQLRLTESEIVKLYDCCRQVRSGIPVQYVLEEAWFCGLKLKVNRHVLIPRPETEELIHLIKKTAKAPTRILDLCTGSSCIALALAKAFPGAAVTGVDVSENALRVARVNAQQNNTAVRFVKADVLKDDLLPGEQFDLIVCNPPYVLQSEAGSLSPHVLAHEPDIALFPPGNDAIVFYRRIISMCSTSLSKNAMLFFELNPITADNVKSFAVASKLFESVNVIEDLSGKDRFLICTSHDEMPKPQSPQSR